MNLVKEKQGGLVPLGLKRWPFKLIKHFADTTCVSQISGDFGIKSFGKRKPQRNNVVYSKTFTCVRCPTELFDLIIVISLEFPVTLI